MRSPSIFKTYHQRSGREVRVYLASPHQFVLDYQQQLLPDWNIAVSYLILVLQQSLVSLNTSTEAVTREKNSLRTKFMHFGYSLVLALQERGYKSDLFDPRTGYPLLTTKGMAFDDNAAVKALLNYRVTGHRQCSLLIHPAWGNHVYPSTIVTSAPRETVNLCLEQITNNFNWTLQSDKS